ncbi:MAG: aminoacyl-tRNA hydrolase [Thermoguttaceae bacterium]|nr:aminoacyl-tRNA hydrolase [Thermoguttaceae bacterium]
MEYFSNFDKRDFESGVLDVNGKISIPLSEIEFTFVRSSGPGGQNVNKVSSKARLRWRLTSGRVDEETVARFKTLYPSWLTEDGDVVIYAQVSRDAPKNKAACLAKLRDALVKALARPKKRIATKPTRGSVERRLAAKRRVSEKKRDRGKNHFD